MDWLKRVFNKIMGQKVLNNNEIHLANLKLADKICPAIIEQDILNKTFPNENDIAMDIIFPDETLTFDVIKSEHKLILALFHVRQNIINTDIAVVKLSNGVQSFEICVKMDNDGSVSFGRLGL